MPKKSKDASAHIVVSSRSEQLFPVKKLLHKAHEQERIKSLLFMMEDELISEETDTDTNEGSCSLKYTPGVEMEMRARAISL